MEVLRAKWEKFQLGIYDFALRLRCSNCGAVVYEDGFRFCPYCGKLMIEEERVDNVVKTQQVE